jgi:dTDP-D-glucose 4,6-dehydratase
MTILVAGDAGFIGSNLANDWFDNNEHVVDLDRLTYVGNLSQLTK